MSKHLNMQRYSTHTVDITQRSHEHDQSTGISTNHENEHSWFTNKRICYDLSSHLYVQILEEESRTDQTFILFFHSSVQTYTLQICIICINER